MTSNLSYSEVRKAVFLLPLQQLACGVIVALIFLVFAGSLPAFAAFYGASVGFVGSLVFALIVFVLGAGAPDQMKRFMFRAESFKILTISLMFYFAFAVLALPFMPVITGFVATLLIYFVALLTKFR